MESKVKGIEGEKYSENIMKFLDTVEEDIVSEYSRKTNKYKQHE